jgi:transcriptional regulator with XRE-family HTH domain
MGRKHKSYIREWREHRGYTQEQLLGRLAEIAGDSRLNDEALAIPRSGASLSRIENGHQNFKIALLEALAEALDVEEPGWLLDRNPLKAGEVVQFSEFAARLDEAQRARALAVLKAMFVEAG